MLLSLIFLVGVFVSVSPRPNERSSSSTHNSCHQNCSHRKHYVCGSDGFTYYNACQLNVAACIAAKNGEHLTQKYTGRCHEPTSPPRPKECDVICDEESNRPLPHCASDGVTYDSKCDFLNAQCFSYHHRLSLVHTGACQDLDSNCTEFANHQDCPDVHEYVCGSDGTTYVNNCTLRMSECRLQARHPGTTVTPIHDGKCHDGSTADARQIDCSQYRKNFSSIAIEGGDSSRYEIWCNKTKATICGTDGVTYTNDCWLCRTDFMTHRLGQLWLALRYIPNGAENGVETE